MIPKSITVVIPIYNEANRIGKTLSEITKYFKNKKIRLEIIIVDDGSSDESVSTIKNAGYRNVRILKNKKNIGKGYSVRKGLLNTKTRYALFTDADLSTPISEIEKFYKYLPGHDIIIGSRKKKDSNVVEKQPPWRVLAGNIFPMVANVIVPIGIKDTQCGFKLLDMDRVRDIARKLTINGFGFDVELLYLAKKSSMKIMELGVDWYNDRETKVKLIKDSIYMLTDLLKIRLNSLTNKYGT